MKKSILIPLIILIVGIGLALAGFGAGGLNSIWFDRGGAHLEERGELVRVDETYPKFANIEIDADYLHSIVIKEGAVFGLKGANYERYGGIDANLDGDTLVISATRKNKGGWLMDFGIGDFRNNDSFLEITCPKGAKLGTVSANLGAGDTLVSGLNCGDLTIDNAFGSVDASRVTCENLAITADAGKVGLDEVDAQGAITVVNKYGDVDMADIRAGSLAATLDAGSINIDAITAKGELAVVNRYGKIGIDEAAAGSLKIELDAGNLLAGNIKAGALSVDNDYGDIGIDRLELTGMGEIKSDTGNVDISLSMDEGDLSYEFDAAVGKVAVDGKDCARSIINRAAGAKASLNVNAKFGNITARFVR